MPNKGTLLLQKSLQKNFTKPIFLFLELPESVLEPIVNKEDTEDVEEDDEEETEDVEEDDEEDWKDRPLAYLHREF